MLNRLKGINFDWLTKKADPRTLSVEELKAKYEAMTGKFAQSDQKSFGKVRFIALDPFYVTPVKGSSEIVIRPDKDLNPFEMKCEGAWFVGSAKLLKQDVTVRMAVIDLKQLALSRRVLITKF